MNKGYLPVLFFIIIGIGFVVIGLTLAYLLRVFKYDEVKNTTYECGMEPFGSSWIQFNIRYYVFALIFIIFDIEAIYLYPWAVTFKQLGITSFLEMLIFIMILFLGLIYAWRKGALEW
jgi:NADH:ubiquinone oxidoreductase subunit 3 (subunit A)